MNTGIFQRTSPRQWLILLAIVVGFLALQMVRLSYRWVDDESWYLMPLPSIHAGAGFNIPTVPGDDVFWPQPPMLTYLEAVSDRIAPLSAATARLVPLLFGVLTILAAFLLGRRLLLPSAGLWAAAFVAADNLVFLASRIVRPEILVTLFLTLALYFGVRSMQAVRRPLVDAGWAGLMGAAAISSHPNGLMVPACVAVFWLFSCRFDRELFLRFLAMGVAVLVATLPFMLWIVANDGGNGFASFHSHWLDRYGRNAETGGSGLAHIAALFAAEWHGRYADFIQFPYRLHIALTCALLVVLSLLSKVRTIRALALLVPLQLLFFLFVNNSNPTVRYMVSLVPIFAVLAAYWLLQAWPAGAERRIAPGTVCAVAIVLSLAVSQVAGNLIYLHRIRNADYDRVAHAVDRIIPPNSVVYGGMFWWLGLREHTVVPYMRMPWQRALREWRPTVVIMDDWVMVGGYASDDWGALRKELDAWLAEHGSLIGKVDGGFYGDLRIYSVDAEQTAH